MTLQEWSTKFNVVVNQHPNGASYVPITINNSSYMELWHLSDYLVSSIQAGTIWLVPRFHSHIAIEE